MAPLERMCQRLGIHHPTFTLCITQFGSTLIHTTFLFYYVKVFLNVYKISEAWFQFAQVLFMFWNAINDPLFGYFQDIGVSWMRSRRLSILYSAPFYVISFLIFWFPWTTEQNSWLVGLHLIVALFFYDGFFSFALLAWSALFAEIATDHVSRVRAVRYSQIFALVGVNVITVMEKLSSSLQDMASFQWGATVLALISFFCLSYTGLYAPDKPAQCSSFKHLLEAGDETSVHSSSKQITHRQFATEGWRLTKEIFRSPNFQRITWMNFFQICRSVTHLNFAAIFTEALITRETLPLGSWQISVFYGACSLAPQLLMILFGAPLVVKKGPHRLMMLSFYASIVCALFTYVLGHIHRNFTGTFGDWLVLIFMFVDSILVHAFSPLTNILFADYVDEDMIQNRRSTPISSMIFSLNALITKPAQSLAPMFVVYFLNSAGYNHYKNSNAVTKSPVDNYSELYGTMFSLLCLFPALLGLAEVMVFRNYTLKDKHLAEEYIEEHLTVEY